MTRTAASNTSPFKCLILLLCLLTHFHLTRAQFTESIFYDSVSKISSEGLINGVFSADEFFYFTGGSYSTTQPIPSITKMDTAGRVIWTAIDPEITGLLGKTPDIEASKGVTSQFLREGGFLYTTSQNSQLWCLNDSSGTIVWKIPIPGGWAMKMLNYSPTEMVLLTGYGGLRYTIINKQTGAVTYSRPLGTESSRGEMLVDNNKCILLAIGDTCYKYYDKELTRLAWKKALPYYTDKSVDIITQDSSNYILAGLNNVRAVDSATGNLIWYNRVFVGYVPLVQSGADGNPLQVMVKDSLIYVTWVSPYVGGLDFRNSFALTCINKTNGNTRYNVAYDFDGIPSDTTLPHTHDELDWPAGFYMDPSGNIYMTGSYDHGDGPQNPGNWGIMKINGSTGAKIFEATITRDSINRNYSSKGLYVEYKYGKMYAAGNIQKQISSEATQPLILSFETGDSYRELFRSSPIYTLRYPSALTGMDSMGNSKMTLLKMIGRSSVVELRNGYNQPIWAKTFSRNGKFLVPHMIRNLRDTAIAVSFMLYSEEPVNKMMTGKPDSILFVRLDTLGQIKYMQAIAHNASDFMAPEPVQIYSDRYNRTNFIYRRQVYSSYWEVWFYEYFAFMIDGEQKDWSVLTGNTLREEERSVSLRKNVSTNIADTMVIFRTSSGSASNAHFCSNKQTSPDGYIGYYLKTILQFQMVFSSIECDSTEQIAFGRDSSGRMLAARYNFHLPQSRVWSCVQSAGTYYTGEMAGNYVYAIGKLQSGEWVISKLDKANGELKWNYIRPNQPGKSWIPVDYRYDQINKQFMLGGAVVDSTSGENRRSYFYVTLDSNGTLIRDVEQPGDLNQGMQIHVIHTLQNGSHFYGGQLSKASLGVVGFYNAECFGNNIVPAISITAKDSIACPGTNQVFTAVAGAGGLRPQFQWQLNGNNIGTGADTLMTGPLNNDDQVLVTMISNADCLQTNSATSSPFLIRVADTLKPAIQISGETNLPANGTTLISAVATNLPANSTYQWQDSSQLHGWLNIPTATESTLFYSPVTTGDQLRCVLNFNKPCDPEMNTISNSLSFVLDDNIDANHGIHYYPNPVVNQLTIDSLQTEDGWQSLQIVSINGSALQTITLLPGQTTVTLNLSYLKTGIYLAVLRGTNNKPVYLKFMKS